MWEMLSWMQWHYSCVLLPVLVLALAGVAEKFTLLSTAFQEGQPLSTLHAYTGVSGGKNISPPLKWSATPTGTRSLLLVCVDRHPIANQWIHWVVTNIPPQVSSLVEGASHTSQMPPGAKEWPNSFGTMGWGGPQPPRGSGKHQYEFILYALNVDSLVFSRGSEWNSINQAISGKVIASAHLSAVFER